jgi:hypothetical protein
VSRAGTAGDDDEHKPEQKRQKELRRQLQIGIDQADRGELSPTGARGTLKRMRAARAKKGR